MPPVTANAGENERGLTEGAEAQEDEHEDEREGQGHYDGETFPRFDEVLELAAELEVITVRELHLFVQCLGGFLHEAGGIAAPHIDEDADAALRALAGDLDWLIQEFHLRHLAEG